MNLPNSNKNPPNRVKGNRTKTKAFSSKVILPSTFVIMDFADPEFCDTFPSCSQSKHDFRETNERTEEIINVPCIDCIPLIHTRPFFYSDPHYTTTEDNKQAQPRMLCNELFLPHSKYLLYYEHSCVPNLMLPVVFLFPVSYNYRNSTVCMVSTSCRITSNNSYKPSYTAEIPKSDENRTVYGRENFFHWRE